MGEKASSVRQAVVIANAASCIANLEQHAALQAVVNAERRFGRREFNINRLGKRDAFAAVVREHPYITGEGIAEERDVTWQGDAMLRLSRYLFQDF